MDRKLSAAGGFPVSKSQIPSTKPGPRPEGGDSEGETGNPPAGWESEGQISGFQVSGFRCQGGKTIKLKPEH